MDHIQAPHLSSSINQVSPRRAWSMNGLQRGKKKQRGVRGDLGRNAPSKIMFLKHCADKRKAAVDADPPKKEMRFRKFSVPHQACQGFNEGRHLQTFYFRARFTVSF